MKEVRFDDVTITGLYAVILEDSNEAVIADLHIGYESAMRMQGVSIPSYQKKIIMGRIDDIIKRYEPSRIIINGDFKHEFGKNLRQEWNETIELLDFIMERSDVLLIRGNHDNFLKTIASKRNIEVVPYYKNGRITVFHGHVNMPAEYSIIAHEHPSITIRDGIGATAKLPCFLVGEDIIVMPAISPLASGTDIISAISSEYLSPVLRKRDVDSMEVYAINGDELLHFSKLGELKRVI